MIDILIVTHGQFGSELLKSAELITGKQKNVETLSLNREDSIQQFGEIVREKIASFLSEDHQLLVLTDLFGGSAANVSAANLKKMSFTCLTGVNLSMLLEALILRNNINDFGEFSQRIMESGINGIKNMAQVLMRK